MFDIDQTLLVRALNSTRQTYLPTYVGLRLIGTQLPSGGNEYLQSIIVRRLNSGDPWRFREFQLYKGTVYNGGVPSHEYRNCIASSPLTSIAEALVLTLLAANPSFQISPRVFSYRWPKSTKSGLNYEFFAEGYKRRNEQIARALSRPNHLAVVTDIKKFYPSANKEKVFSMLAKALKGAGQAFGEHSNAVLGFYEQLLSHSKSGIPVGTASSHVLGHLVLRDVDAELTKEYGDNYFRYVDDIVVVCHSSDELSVKKKVQDCIELHGFLLNADKTLSIDSQSWHRNIMRDDVVFEDSFRDFSKDLGVYLAFHPGRAESLSRLLTGSGLSIPVGKLLALSSYSRFRYFLKKSKSGVSKNIGLLLAKNEDFLSRALSLKKVHEETLSSLIKEPVESSENLRRLQVQRIRRVLNVMFYLRDFNEWKSDEIFDRLPELVEQKALASALYSGNVNSILPFSGRGPAAFSELWAEHRNDNATFEKKEALGSAEIEALTVLKLHGVIHQTSLEDFYGHKDSRLMRVVSERGLTARSKPDLSFEDEFESLCLGASSYEISELTRSRHSLTENTALEALSLMSSEYRS
jgi:hypothetical protein